MRVDRRGCAAGRVAAHVAAPAYDSGGRPSETAGDHVYEHCLAQLDGKAERLPGPWFEHDERKIASGRLRPKQWQVLEILWRRHRVGRSRSTRS